MRTVSLRCRGCVISVADYNERRYGLHVIGLCDIIRIADFTAPNIGYRTRVCLLIASSSNISFRFFSETKTGRRSIKCWIKQLRLFSFSLFLYASPTISVNMLFNDHTANGRIRMTSPSEANLFFRLSALLPPCSSSSSGGEPSGEFETERESIGSSLFIIFRSVSRSDVGVVAPSCFRALKE